LQAKKELAKKEGRLLTDKQKKDKAQAEIARKALIASGVRIEGLDRPPEASTSSGVLKRVVYGNKKKKPTAQTHASSPPPAPSPSLPPAATLPSVETPLVQPIELKYREEAADDAILTAVKDDWDASSDSDDDAPAPAPPPGKPF
jgi:translation initiation factor 5B